jgi:hypothetical protein
MTETTDAPTLPPMAASTSDFDFLQGTFDVVSRRLRDPFDVESGWTEARATSSARTHFAGAISVDEMWFPADGLSGLSLRLFDPVEGTWTVYWVNSRTGHLQSPVTGRWADGRCRLTGPDDYAGRAILASYSWSDITATSGRWEQCFSVDDGATWQPNWTMDFVVRDAPLDHHAGPRVSRDFDFLTGPWRVHHRRLMEPLHGGTEWVESDSTTHGCTYFNGAVSIDEIGLTEPGRRGFSFRTFDPAHQQWSIYWVNSRDGRLQPPVMGRFVDGVGRFDGVEEIDGQTVHVRFLWTDITDTTARWRQYFSVDGGATWQENWEMLLTRDAAHR